MKYGRALSVAILLGVVASGCSKEDPLAFSKVDYNKDDKIIFEELIVAFPDMTVEEFLAADADRNGVLDQKEYQRLREARAAGKKLDASSAPPAPAAPAQDAKPAAPPAPAVPAQDAKPGAPATPAEPPKPAAQGPQAAEPAKPEAVPAPTAPAAPAAPAEQSQPTPPPAAAVETVTVEQAPAAPAASQGQTYTIARGDSLTRIAKKFGVSVKAIMEANNMKDADRLEAGATLTIPSADGAAGAVSSPAVTDLVTGYFAKSSSGDINGLVDYYAEKVDYYKKGKRGRDVVRQDKADYFARWPERSYTPGKATVAKLPNGDLRVTVPTAFTVKKGKDQIQGKANFTFILRRSGSSFQIVGEQSQVTEKR